MSDVTQDDPRSGIADIVIRNIFLLKELQSTTEHNESWSSKVVSQLTRFKLWAGRLGAHRHVGHRSLEYRLRDVSHIRSHIISLLQDLEQSTNNALLAVEGEDCTAELQSGEEHDGVESELDKYFSSDDAGGMVLDRLLEEIETVLGCLLRLSVAMRNPAPHDQFTRRVGDDLERQFVHYDTQHVRQKFPELSFEIAERLGIALARRRQYFKYREEHADRLVLGIDEELSEEGLELCGEKTTIASSLPKAMRDPGWTVEKLEDLDVDQSVGPQTSFASSNARSGEIRVPPLPKESNQGPFECPFCRTIVSIDNRLVWKKHVYHDLQPYVCLEETCSRPYQLYTKRSDWSKHMREEHWRVWRCSFGCHEQFDYVRNFRDHQVSSHGEHVTEDYLITLEELSSHFEPTKIKAICPLCFDFHIESEPKYISHVGKHLQTLALFALPDRQDDEGVNSDEVNSDSLGGLEDHLGSEQSDGGKSHGSVRDTAVQDGDTTFNMSTSAFKLNQILDPSQTPCLRYQTYDVPETDSQIGYTVHHSAAFQPGKICKVYRSEPKGRSRYATETEVEEVYKLGELTYQEFRRFLVIANDTGHPTCVACAKPGVKASKHGIIFDERKKAKTVPGEPPLGFNPVRAQMYDDTETLAKEARVNYSRPSTIEHNARVWFIGEVHPDDFNIVTKAYTKCRKNMTHVDQGRRRRHGN